MRYAIWPGNPCGDDEDVTRCIAEVFDRMHDMHRLTRQCKRIRGWLVIVPTRIVEKTVIGAYCRQHAQQLARKWQEGEW